MKPAVTISGSFQKALDDIRQDIESFEEVGCVVLSPRMFKSHSNKDGFVVLDSDGGRRPAAIHGRHLTSIDKSVLLWVRNPGGYVGLSTSLEIGYAHAIGVPVFSSEPAADESLNRYMKVASSPEEAFESIKASGPGQDKPELVTDPQTNVAIMSSECGFEEETDEEILNLLDGEVAELKEAVSEGRLDPGERHSVAEELADCAIYLYHFANQSGIKLGDAISKKVLINIGRWGRKSETA